MNTDDGEVPDFHWELNDDDKLVPTEDNPISIPSGELSSVDDEEPHAIPNVSWVNNNTNGGGDGTFHAEWDNLLYQDGEDYVLMDSSGSTTTFTNGPDAFQDAIDETDEGGFLVVEGYYLFEEGEEVYLEKDMKIWGYNATLETGHEDVGSIFFHIRGNETGSYTVTSIDHRNSGQPVLQFDQNVNDIMGAGDLAMLETDETREIYDDTDGTELGCGHRIAMTAEEEDDAHEDTDFLDDLEDDEVTLEDLLEFDYDLLYDLVARHIEPVTVDIRGFDIIGPDIWYPEVVAFELRGTVDSRFVDIDFYNVAHECFRALCEYKATFRNIDFSHGASNYEGGDGYGIVFKGGSAHNLVDKCHFQAMRHGLAHAGTGHPGNIRRRTTVQNSVFSYHRSTALDMHGADIEHTVINCAFLRGRDDGADHCAGATFIGCYFNIPGNAGIHSSGRGPGVDHDVDIDNCTFVNCSRGVRFSRDTTRYGKISITNSLFRDCSEGIQSRYRIDNLHVHGNRFVGGGDAQIEIATRGDWSDRNYETNGFGVRSGQITDNYFEDVGDECIYIYNDGTDTGDYDVAEDLVVANNHVNGADEFIRGDVEATGCIVANNKITGSDFIRDETGGFDDFAVVYNMLYGAGTAFSTNWDWEQNYDESDFSNGVLEI